MKILLWFLAWLTLTTLILLFNYGAHMNDETFDTDLERRENDE